MIKQLWTSIKDKMDAPVVFRNVWGLAFFLMVLHIWGHLARAGYYHFYPNERLLTLSKCVDYAQDYMQRGSF